MNSVRVSVIIPAYNREKVIGEAIQSVLAQTFQDFEILVVDDASTDKTAEVVKEFDDTRIRYFRHEENLYAAASRNTGMKNAKGQYIAFLDSDDEWLPDKLEMQTRKLDSLDPVWACSCTGANIYKNNSKTSRVYRPKTIEGDPLTALLLKKLTVWTPTFMFRREILADIGNMDDGLQRCEDLDFYIRIISKYKIAVIQEPLARINLDTSKPLSSIAVESKTKLLAKHREAINSLGVLSSRKLYASERFILASLFFGEGSFVKGTSYWLSGIVLFPFLPPRRYMSVGYSAFRGVKALGKNHSGTH